MADNAFKQDLPPKGGYAPINYKRIPAKRVLTAPLIFGGLIGSMAYGRWSWDRGMQQYNKEKVEMRSADLALEPLMLAERDREFLKQCRKNRDAEAELMKDVDGWVVGTWFGHKVYKTTGDAWVEPEINEFYAHTSEHQRQMYRNHVQWLKTE